MDLTRETESESVNSSLWPHNPKSLAEILTEIYQNVQSMLRLIEDHDHEPESTEKFLCLYQSLSETYNDLNQELLNGLLKFDFKLSCSDHNNASSLVTPMGSLSSFKCDIFPPQELDLESGTSYSSLKHQLVSPGRATSSKMLQSLMKPNCEVEKNQSASLLADMFCAELETAWRELEARNIDIETEKKHVLDLQSKLSDSSYKIKNLESKLDVITECLGVSKAEGSKLLAFLSKWKSEKAKLQTDDAVDLLNSLRAELRSRENQIKQMEEYLNQVCPEDTMFESGADKNVVGELRGRPDLLDTLRAELRSRDIQIEQMEEYLNHLNNTDIMSESRTEKIVIEELRARVKVLEREVELQRNMITEREEEKREAIRQLLNGLLKFGFKLSCSDHKNASSLVTPMETLSSLKSDISPSQELDLESGTSYSSLKHQVVSPGRTTRSEMLQSLMKPNGEVEKNLSAFLLADMFCAELETSQRELEAKNIDIEIEKSHVFDLESKLSDSSYMIRNLESNLNVITECLGISKAEGSKLMALLGKLKSEKAKLQSDNAADLLNSLRGELRSRENQSKQMGEYLNQVCLEDTEIIFESGTDKNVLEELRGRPDLLDTLRAELRSRDIQIEQMEEYLNQECGEILGEEAFGAGGKRRRRNGEFEVVANV